VKGIDEALRAHRQGSRRAARSISSRRALRRDYVRNVNRRANRRGRFRDVTREIANIMIFWRTRNRVQDPFAGRHRRFQASLCYLKEAGEIMPYRLYIPPAYDGTKAFPMVLALHGLRRQ